MIYQMEPWIGEEERKAIDEYLASNPWLTEYKKTTQFAQMIAEHVGSRHCLILPSGTVSLFTILAALRVGRGDEVVVPDCTMIASANAVVLAGATPVFVDVDPGTLCLNLDLAESAISDRTKAIMLVSLNGRAPDMNRAMRLAETHRVHLVEDAAQSLGSLWRGRPLGTFGIAGSFSFSAPKIITTGQGGAVVTDDSNLADRIAGIRDFGRLQSGVDSHLSIGYNFKFTDLQAVIGIEQMKKLPHRVERKKEMFALYWEQLNDMEPVHFLQTDLGDVAPWFIDVLVPDPEGLQKHLAQREIGSRRFHPAIHSQPAYNQIGSFPNADYAASHGLWLPSSAFLDDASIERVCQAIREYYR